ncbi:MAG: MaoC/PaaZ C-terminal domain-containing protein [Polyangiaceae bacterium]
MPVPSRFILHQGPVISGLGRALVASIVNRRRRGGGSVSVPGPMIEEVIPPRPRDLVRCYVATVGGDPGAYKQTLPPHLFPQWGFPLASRCLSVLDYPLQRGLNAGCRIEVKGPLPQGEPLHVRARIEEIDDDGYRAIVRTRIWTGTASAPDAVIGDLSAIFPLKKRPDGGKKERPRVPEEARELRFFRLGPSAGLEFAKLTGDFNPIHWIPAAARASGFRNVILHGFGTLAHACEGLNRALFSGDVTALESIDVRFTSPLVLPAKVGLYLDGDHIFVGDAPGGRAYLTGTIRGSIAGAHIGSPS